MRLAVQQQLDAFARLDAADHREAARVGDRGEQLVVLAEAEVVDRRAGRERHPVELDHAAHARAAGEVAGVDREPVGDVEHRVRAAARAASPRRAGSAAGRSGRRGTRRRPRRAGP